MYSFETSEVILALLKQNHSETRESDIEYI